MREAALRPHLCSLLPVKSLQAYRRQTKKKQCTPTRDAWCTFRNNFQKCHVHAKNTIHVLFHSLDEQTGLLRHPQLTWQPGRYHLTRPRLEKSSNVQPARGPRARAKRQKISRPCFRRKSRRNLLGSVPRNILEGRPTCGTGKKGDSTISRGHNFLLFGGELPNSQHSCTHDKNLKCCKQTDKNTQGNAGIRHAHIKRHQHPKFGTSQGTLSDSKGRKNTGNGQFSSASYNYFLPFTGFNTLKLHMRVSSMLIMAPALSNSPQ